MATRTKHNLFTLGGLALTTALSTFSMSAHADTPWGNLSGDGFSTNQLDAKNTVIDTHQMVAVGRGSNLDILSDESVRVNTMTNNGVFVASRVADNLLPTMIDGKLSSNGKIVIQDTNGILYGSNSRIDVNGLVSTTAGTVNIGADGKSIDLDDFSDNGEIVIEQGSMISVKDGGLAAFVAPTVVNNGVISAKAGKVELAGSNTKTTVDLYGDGLLEIAVNDENTARLIAENNGSIEGGVVHMTTGAAKDIVDSVVNMNGAVAASSATQVGGKIVLGGANTGTVKVAGNVDASGKKGGGTVIAAAKSVDITETATINADAIESGDGGTVKVLGDQYAGLAADVSAKGGAENGDGGFVELSSNEDFLLGGSVDTTAANGETGTFLIDPRDIDIRLGVRQDLNLNRVYESDIEVLSLLTNIDILARRNITVNANTYGASDGVVNVNGGNDLTIRTTNSPYQETLFGFTIVNETDNAGVIDLTGNSTYGANLEFRATGNGDINILGATDGNQASNIKVSKLTTENGNINVNTKNGSIAWMGDVTTQGGDINGTATGQNQISSKLTTNSGDVTLTGSGANFWDTGIMLANNGVVESATGDIALNANDTKLVINGKAKAGAGNLDLIADAAGRIEFWGAGEVQGDTVNMESGLGITQGANGKIMANTLTGQANQSVSLLGENNAIKTLANFSTGNAANHKGGFTLANTGNIDVVGTVSSDNTGASGNGNIAITTTGDWTVKSTGGVTTQDADITLASDSLVDVDMGANVAAGNGDITVNASNVNLGADLNTIGTVAGTATTVNVENNTAQIQDGIDVAVNGADVNVAAGTYTETVNLNKDVSLNGANAGNDANGARVGETVLNNAGDWYNIYVDADGATIDGLTINGNGDNGNNDYAVITDGAGKVTVANNIIGGSNFGVFFWDNGKAATGGGLITQNQVSNVGTQGIHVRGSQYADITNNTIFNAPVGVTVEFMANLNPEAGTPVVDGNTVSASLIGIRNNPVTGNGTGYTISNNTITAEGASEARRWTGIDIVSQAGNVATTFLNNTIDGSALNGSGRATAGYEITNVNSPNLVIDGGNVSNVDYGVWATDGSSFSGQVNDVMIKNVAFANIGKAGILAEDVIDPDNAGSPANTTGTTVTIGAGNTFTDTPYELAVAGGNVTVNLDGIDGMNSVLVKAAGGANFDGDPVANPTTRYTTENASIQTGVDATALNGNVQIEAGTFTEGNIELSKAIRVRGSGKTQTIIDADGYSNGFIIEDDLGNRNVSLVAMGVKNANGAGVRVSDTADMKVLQINQMAFENNGYQGVAVYGNSMKELRILNSDFLNNGFAGGSRGEGDIMAYLYNGDVTLKNVDIQSNNPNDTADYGIQIRGDNTLAQSGVISLDNVSVSGEYRAALLGIQEFDGIGGLTMNNVTLGGQTDAGTDSAGWGALYFSNLGDTDIDLGNTSFDAVNGQYITLGAGAGYNTTNAIDATGVTFEGVNGATATLAENFAIEDKVFHALDLSGQGVVTWKDNNVFVTQNSGSIQRGIDASNVGGIVNVNDGTYNENVMVNKAVSVFGNSSNATNVKIQGTGTGNGLTLAADDIDLRYLTVDGFANGIYTNTAINNTFMRNVNSYNNANYGFEIHNNADVNGLDMRNVRISNNGSVGMRIRGAAENVSISGGVMSGNKQGLVSVAGNGENKAFNNVTITNTKFVANTDKGIYLEKLSNATIKGVEVRNSGTNAASGNNAGIDVNLKYGDFENITFDTVNVNGSGAASTGLGLALTVKAQNSGSYAGNPATLTNLVIKDSTVTAAGGGAVAIGGGVDGVTIDNTTMTGPEALAFYGGVQNVDVQNNILTSTGLSSRGGSYGIGVFGNGGTTILANNTVNGANVGTGILVSGTDDASIVDNTVTDFASGVVVDGGSNALVDDNAIQNFSAFGVEINNASGANVTDNLIASTEAGATGVNVVNSTDTIVGGIGNTLRNRINDVDTGVNVDGGANTSIIGNDIKRTVTGVLATDTAALDVNNNTIVNADTGIDATRSDNAKFNDNTINNTAIGIFLEEGTNAQIDDNDITNFSDAAIVLERTIDADVTDNLIKSTSTGAIGVDVIDAVGTQIGGDGNTLRNRIFDVDTGVKLSGDTDTTIDGNDFRRNGVAIASDFDPAYTTMGLTVTDNTIRDGGMAMVLANTPDAMIGGADDANIITNNGGILLSNSDGAIVDGNVLTDINGAGISAINSDGVFVINNAITNASGNGVFALSGLDNVINGNTITNPGQNGINVQNTLNATIADNIISGATNGAGVLVDGSVGTAIVENEISDGAIGIGVRGYAASIIEETEGEGEVQVLVSAPFNTESDDTLILGNTITNNEVGVQTIGNGVNLVQALSNDLDANAIGFLLQGGEIDISNLLAPNTITGGETSMVFDGPDVSLVNNSLGATIFTDQTGNYVTLQNGALFNPGTPTIIDGLAANYNGVVPLNSPLGAGLITGAQRTAIEALIQDFNDDATLGDIIVGLGFDVDEEDLFALGLFSFSPAAANVNVTFRGLPPVSAPSLNALANISPAAGGDDLGAGSAAEFASLEPAAGGNDGCWAAVGETGFDGTVNFSFGGGIDSAISDSACAQ